MSFFNCIIVLFLTFIVISLPSLILFFIIIKLIITIKSRYEKRLKYVNKNGKIVAFFHPYCNAGGGGERVLWCAIRALQMKYPQNYYIVYTGDTEVNGGEMLRKVETTFKITFSLPIEFIYLNGRHWVESKKYPIFTLLGQSLGSIVLAFEAIYKCAPHICIDSMGYSFTFPIFKYFGGSRVACYVHYPTISTDMLSVVSRSVTSYNNRSFIANNSILTHLKVIYYHLFAALYGITGRISDVIMVNSGWTREHIIDLWRVPMRTHIVYPPCNTDTFKKLHLNRNNKYRIVSIAQFRPEKNHGLQLKAFKEFIERLDNVHNKMAKLILIGSCRNSGDEERVKQLQELRDSLSLANSVEFRLNITFEELLKEMQNANIGIHTMINEHFGIGVVECLASGLITIAHDSAGPKMDIISHDINGFLATDIKSFSDMLYKITEMDESRLTAIRKYARNSVDKFSEQEFDRTFLNAIESIF